MLASFFWQVLKNFCSVFAGEQEMKKKIVWSQKFDGWLETTSLGATIPFFKFLTIANILEMPVMQLE